MDLSNHTAILEILNDHLFDKKIFSSPVTCDIELSIVIMVR